MNKCAQQEPEQSVANRVLSTFLAAVGEDNAMAEVAARLRLVLLDGDIVNETALRQAIFGNDL